MLENYISICIVHAYCSSVCLIRWNEVELNCGLLQSFSSQTPSASQFRVGSPSSSASLRSSSGSSGNAGASSSDGEEMLTCQLENLSPATAYSAFITIATLNKYGGSQSQRFHFTTKPASTRFNLSVFHLLVVV